MLRRKLCKWYLKQFCNYFPCPILRNFSKEIVFLHCVLFENVAERIFFLIFEGLMILSNKIISHVQVSEVVFNPSPLSELLSGIASKHFFSQNSGFFLFRNFDMHMPKTS